MQAHSVETVRDLVKALNGPKRAANVLGTTPQNVVNWQAEGKIPARHFLNHRRLLSEQGIDAASSLWGFAGAAA